MAIAASLRAKFSGAKTKNVTTEGASVLLPISVGQRFHEGEEFAATIDLVNKSASKCTIMLADTLQRHTLQMLSPASRPLTVSEAYFETQRKGDKWLERQQAIYTQLTVPYNIIRWNDCLNNIDFLTASTEIMRLYRDNDEFNNTVRGTADEFIERAIKKHDIKRDIEALHKACTVYILEECAVALAGVSHEYNITLYPRTNNSAMAMLFDKIINKNDYALLSTKFVKLSSDAMALAA